MTIRELVKKTQNEKGVTTTEIAKAINYSVPSTSQYLADKYAANPAKIEAAFVAWLRRQGVSTTGEDFGSRFIDTDATTKVFNACRAAQEEGAITVIIGAPGLGKTVGIRRWMDYARREQLRFIHITAHRLTSAVSFVRDLGVQLGLRDRTAAQLVNSIQAALNGEPSVLLIDEAQHLDVRTLEVIRGISDATMTGVVFAGSLALAQKLDEGDGTAPELAQLQDRVAVIERLKPLTALEVNRFVRQWTGVDVMDAEAMDAIRDISRGVPRRLVRLLTHTRQLAEGSGKSITGPMVRVAGQRLVKE
jgi:DNA transposition AAA+ family ATPase